MLLMGLHEIYNQSIPHVAHLTFDEVCISPEDSDLVSQARLLQNRGVQFFETVIRYLGGLLTVYSMTKDPLFLARADDLGHHLLPAFKTQFGLPTFYVNPKT